MDDNLNEIYDMCLDVLIDLNKTLDKINNTYGGGLETTYTNAIGLDHLRFLNLNFCEMFMNCNVS